MATVAELARSRKRELKQIQSASLQLDAKQEALEREVKRIMNRKRAVPELADLQRMLEKATEVDNALGVIVSLMESMSTSWSTV